MVLHLLLCPQTFAYGFLNFFCREFSLWSLLVRIFPVKFSLVVFHVFIIFSLVTVQVNPLHSTATQYERIRVLAINVTPLYDGGQMFAALT